MSEVINLRDGQPVLSMSGPIDEIVQKLEETLEAAKRGEVRAIALVVQMHPIAHPDCSYETVYDFGDDGNLVAMMGALDRVKHRMNLEMDGDE